jgi:2-succinyl-5-enolpyruvyl-6-hydroxy-3-cyclohexene-1-carboxylate synthase
VVRERGEVIDPAHTAKVILEGDAPAICRALTGAGALQRPLRALFDEAERRVRSGLEAALSFGEPMAAREAARASELLYVSSSMPVRDLDAFGGAPRGRVLCNRGLNGIDGIVSCAAGAAWATGAATTVLLGDLALLHDLGGLVAAARLALPLRVLCVNNDGGGIFHFLPIAKHQDVFEPLFGTPHGLDLRGAATLAGAEHVLAGDERSLRAALEPTHRLRLVEVRTDRARNVEQHRALQAAALAALGDPP